MIISTDAEKAFNKMQHPFTIKTFQEAEQKEHTSTSEKPYMINPQQTLSSMEKN